MSSACTGLGTAAKCCERLVGRQNVTEDVACDKWATARDFVKMNHSVTHWHDSIASAVDEAAKATRVSSEDLYVAGFPCQPYSFANGKASVRNPFMTPEGQCFIDASRFIDVRMPKFAVLEN
eukprot:7915502-Alexandrium_andersonii.AAC.1